MKHNCCRCKCKDMEDCGGEEEKFWGCSHFNNEQICEVCCLYDVQLGGMFDECPACMNFNKERYEKIMGKTFYETVEDR